MNLKRHTLSWAVAFGLLFHVDLLLLRFWPVCDGAKWVLAGLGMLALAGAALGMARELKRWGWL